MTRGRYMDSIRSSSPSPSPYSFLRSFADEKVTVNEPEEPDNSPDTVFMRKYESAVDKGESPSGIVSLLYGGLKKAKEEREGKSFGQKFKEDVANDPNPSGLARGLASAF
tara:strand:- start:10 stop:339 length:330 start_codon:yes stop_codon:yes gene_type:complete